MVFVIRLSKKNTSQYYRGMNLISTSNLLYRIKSNATILATIAILSATTLTAVGMSYGMYHDTNKAVNHYNPFSYIYWSNAERDQKVNQAIARHPQNKLLHSLKIEFISADLRLPGPFNTHLAVVAESSYNNAAQIKGWEKVDINKQKEAVLVASNYDVKEDFNHQTIPVEFYDKSKKELYIIGFRPYKFTNNSNTTTTLVIRDEAYKELAKTQKPNSLRALIVDNQKESQALTAELGKVLPPYTWDSYYSKYMWNMEQRGMLMFIGGFLGLVILLATGSIIYFRQLNEAQKEKLNYQILRNIGVSRKEICASVSKQVLFIFLFPLLAGIAHSWVALMALADLLSTSLIVPTIITIAIYMIIYIIYYRLTVNSYNRIVNQES